VCGGFPSVLALWFAGLLFKGKPVERRGRKATGLQRRAMTAGLPTVDVMGWLD